MARYDFPNKQSFGAVPEELFRTTLVQAMSRVYFLMFVGLMLTAVMAGITLATPLINVIFASPFIFYSLIIVELIMVFAIGRVVYRISTPAGALLFLAYAALNGVTLASIFLIYTTSSIVWTFVSTALLFGVMSVIGYTTKQDLTGWGPILFMGLIGVIIASIVNIFIGSTMLEWIISLVGVAVFLGLTIYDTNQIKNHTLSLLVSGQNDVVAKVGVIGALRLYLDFINLFLMLLRLFGRRR